MFNLLTERDEPWSAGKLLSGDNKVKAENEILFLNTFIEEARTRYFRIPAVAIKRSQLVFLPKGKPDIKDYVWIKEIGDTPTGREPKYPQVLHFWAKNRGVPVFRPDEIFGDISYDTKGQAGKATLIIWNKGKGYLISCGRKKDGEMRVIGIDTMMDGKKEKVYRYK